VPVALSGRVPTSVSLQNGPIAVGDRITLSSTPGVGMKAGAFDPSVGLALEPYTASSTGNSIEVFVTLGGASSQQLAALAAASATSSASTTVAEFNATGATTALQGVLSSALNAITGVAQSGVRELGLAVHASLGVFDNLITQTLTATTVNADVVQVNQKLCIGSTCVTEAQLQQLLQNAGQPGSGDSGSSGGSGSGNSPSIPPTITLDGDNPTTVNVGDAYSDLGGTVSGPGSDSNLQLMASVDGAATTTADQIQVDTGAVGTHVIIYSATDTNGLTGYASREVDVASSTTP
jgi:hypothetical protein